LTSSQNAGNNSDYFLSMLFTDFLKEIMLSKCKDDYRKSKSEAERIEFFRNTSTPNTVIDWYTKDSFVYCLVNQTFRSRDILLWY
jgi:hypothetical protein